MCKMYQVIGVTCINAIDTANHLLDESTFVRVFALEKKLCVLYNSINDLLKYCTSVINIIIKTNVK